jgi:hypothetical protein
MLRVLATLSMLSALRAPIAPTEDPSSVYTMLCDHAIVESDLPQEYVNIRRMLLAQYHLTVTIKYGMRVAAATLAHAEGIGFRLDDAPIVAITQPTSANAATATVSFFGLKRGKHRIAIGLAQASGELEYVSNSYCFTAPGHFDRTGNLYI